MADSSGEQHEPEKVGARLNSTSSASKKSDCPEVTIATAPQEVRGQHAYCPTRTTLKVTLLGSEWNSSAGGLSTLNRELAIHLSKHPKVEVSLLVPEGACKDGDKRAAQSCGVTIVDAKKRPAFDPLDWLSFPPQDLSMDIVVGHGVKLGRQGQIIRDSSRFHNCKWVQVVHTAPEDLSKFKRYADPISKGERKHQDEVDLCKLADLVVPVGPRLEEFYSSYLRRCKKDQDVLSVTPGLFDREFGDLEQAPNENADFKVLMFGRGDDEDFELKGYNLAAKAFTDQRLKRKPIHLIFVGAPDRKQEEVRQKLVQCGIAEEQLIVRAFIQGRERMKDLLCEADLAIMPSKSEGFGLVALEALSAGLPILVGSKSGFAKALENVPIGHSCIVDSDDPTKWAEAIEAVRTRHRMRLKEIKALRASYETTYCWKEQCEALVGKMWLLINGPSNGSLKTTEEGPHPGKRAFKTTEDGASFTFTVIKHSYQDLNDEQQEIVREILMRQIQVYTRHHNVATRDGVGGLIEHIKETHHLALKSVGVSSLVIKVQCPTLESLESLWNDYCSGDLNEVAERYLVTDEIKKKLNLETLRLKTTIEEENYLICKKALMEKSRCTVTDVAFLQKARPHSSQQPQPIEESSISLKKKENAVTTSKESHNLTSSDQGSCNVNEERPNVEISVEKQQLVAFTSYAASRPSSNQQTPLDEETKDCGKNEEGVPSSSRQSPRSISEVTHDQADQAITVQIKITAQDLDDHQQEIFDDLMQQMEEQHNLPDKGLGALTEYLTESHSVLQKGVTKCGLKMIVECSTPESLESLLNDYHSGHFNDVAERCLVTDEVKTILNLETLRLKTVFQEVADRQPIVELKDAVHSSPQPQPVEARSISESSSNKEVAGISSNPFDQTEPDQGASARWPDTSSKIQKATRGALHKASISGQHETVEMLLKSGEDVDQRDQFLLTPLHLACWYGQESVVKLLLDHGANVNAVDRFLRTPLQKAERYNCQSIVQLLLKNNANPIYQPLSLKSLAQKAFLYVEERSGYNMLQAYVLEGNYSNIENACVYLDNFLGEMSLKTTGNTAKLFPGKTAVDILSNLDKREQCYADIYELYQEYVKKVNTFTELHWCADRDDAEETVELVLNNGVDINIPALGNRTPLLWASVSSSSEFIKTLIDLGADVNAQRTEDKVSSLLLAAGFNNYATICLLLEHGADVNLQDNDGNAPLHRSTRGAFYEVSKLLIAARSNINLRNKKGRTPLYIAVERKHEQLIKLLFENNADVQMRLEEDPINRVYLVRGKDKGKPAWHYVKVEKHLLGLFLKRAKEGNLDVADYGTVLESGWGNNPPEDTRKKIVKKAETRFQEIRGETLLHVASRNNSTEIIDLLVKNGAWDVNARDAEGFTPLHMAAIHGNMQAVKKLVDLGADVNQAVAILDFAYMNEEREIEEYLKSKIGSTERTDRQGDASDVNPANLFRGARSIGGEGARVLEESVTRALDSNSKMASSQRTKEKEIGQGAIPAKKLEEAYGFGSLQYVYSVRRGLETLNL